MDLESKIREVPDFPTPGIGFKDIMPLLADADALRDSVDRMAEWAAPRSPEVVLAGRPAGSSAGPLWPTGWGVGSSRPAVPGSSHSR